MVFVTLGTATLAIVTVVVPAEMPFTRPFSFTVATAGSAEVNVTSLLKVFSGRTSYSIMALRPAETVMSEAIISFAITGCATSTLSRYAQSSPTLTFSSFK